MLEREGAAPIAYAAGWGDHPPGSQAQALVKAKCGMWKDH
jgi:hypothetical protein